MDINSLTLTLDSLTTSTWYDVRQDIVDQVWQIRPFYDKMVEAGKIKERVPEGTHFEIPVRYAKQDQTIQWFGRGDTFSVAEKESLTRLIFYTKNLGTNVTRYWQDVLKNRGKAKIINFVEEQVDNAKESLIDKLATSLLVQDSDANSIDALPTLISSTPTSGSIGGLTRSSNAYLQNNVKNFSGLTTTVSLLDEMTRMYNLCTLWRGGKPAPDIIVTTREVYQDYERIARAMQTIMTNKSERASLGFGDLMFKNIEMFWDPNCPAGSMYFLNTSTLELAYDPMAWFEMTEWKPLVGNSLDRVAQIVAVCALICTNFRKNGVIYNIDTVTS